MAMQPQGTAHSRSPEAAATVDSPFSDCHHVRWALGPLRKMTFSMRWLWGRDGSRESQVKHFSESCTGSSTIAWVQRPRPCQSHGGAMQGLTWRWLTMQYSCGPCIPHVEVALRRGALPTSRFPVAG